MRILDDIKLDFDDVLILPKRSTLTSRSEVDLKRDFGFYKGVPIVAANMDTVGTFEMAEVFEKNKMMTCLHKHYKVDEYVEYFSKPRDFTFYTMGITDADMEKWKSVYNKVETGNIRYVCIDVANGYTERFIDFVKRFKNIYSEITLMAGNVVSAEITEQLILNGAELVKIGIGGGSACTTRIKTGVGMPQLSAIIECSDAAHGLNGRICADGGCNSSGDIAKAFGAGADFVMLGGMLAGHNESGGDIINENGKQYKLFYGMSSDTAQIKHTGSFASYKSSEGRTTKIPYRGDVQNTINDMLGGLRSSCTYIGSKSLREFSKCVTFVRVNNTHNRVYTGNEI